MSSLLFDTLFRPTTMTPSTASAAPVRVRGTRTRAGNAMDRTRAALLAGAARAVEESGTRITMAQVAAASGVAKATLYNHFRTRDAVLEALAAEQVRALIEDQIGKPLGEALADAAMSVSAHPLRSALARLEPAALASVARVDGAAQGWRLATEAVDAVLADAGRAGGSTVVRWLSSFLVTPADSRTIGSDVAVLLAGLPEVPLERTAG